MVGCEMPISNLPLECSSGQKSQGGEDLGLHWDGIGVFGSPFLILERVGCIDTIKYNLENSASLSEEKPARSLKETENLNVIYFKIRL